MNYECNECGKRYSKYNDAIECCNESTILFMCDKCNKNHATEGKSNDCCVDKKITVHTENYAEDVL